MRHFTSTLEGLADLLEIAQQEVQLFDDVVKSLSVLENPQSFKWEGEKKLREAWVASLKRSPAVGRQTDV